jgi:3-deoxy-manno-octulosonate cytidylyltransferase (CMP-KDO synthetase)
MSVKIDVKVVEQLKVLAVIPARLNSTRLSEKMLLRETGKPLIVHTWEKVCAAKTVSDVIVATDSPEISDIIKSCGGNVEMTSAAHQSGTDRINEVVKRHAGYDIILNIQGDEPEVNPQTIDFLIEVQANAKTEIGTVAAAFSSSAPTTGAQSPHDPNCVKIVLGQKLISDKPIYEAIYFSRSLVPFPRDKAGVIENASDYIQHMGLYAYTPASLDWFSKLGPSQLEKRESLEQLRCLVNGGKIAVGLVESAHPGIDTRDDYDGFVKRAASK